MKKEIEYEMFKTCFKCEYYHWDECLTLALEEVPDFCPYCPDLPSTRHFTNEQIYAMYVEAIRQELDRK